MRLISDIGFEPVDAGELKAARLLEPLAMLMMQLADDNSDIALIMARRRTERDFLTKAHAMVTEEAE